MNKESFESLENYKPSKKFVNESLLLEKDNDGVLGSIVDRGLTFVPRAMRFKKAKKAMRSYLEAYTKKSKNLINKFSKSLNKKVSKIEDEYSKFEEKIKSLVDEGKKREAIKLAKEQLKELEAYKKEQMRALEKGIESILSSYTSSIHHRIDNPGFVLNVELSEKGKGELKAKWQELAAIQTTKIDEYKIDIIKTTSWERLDEISSQLSGFIESISTHGRSADINFRVQYILKNEKTKDYTVKTHLRIETGRITLEEKGVIYGSDQDRLRIGEPGVTVRVAKGTHEYTASTYNMVIDDADKNDYVRGYIIIKGRPEPIYTSNMYSFMDATTPQEQKKGHSYGGHTDSSREAERKSGESSGGLEDVEPLK